MMRLRERRIGPVEVWTVLYRPAGAAASSKPESYVCLATNYDSADDQCQSAYEDCEVLWVMRGSNVDLALTEYFETRYDEEAVAA